MYKKRSIVFDANMIYFILITCFIFIRIASSTFKINQGVGFALNIIIQIVLMLVLPVIMFTVLRKQKLKDTLNNFNFKKISFKAIIISVLIGFLIYGLTVFVASFFSLVLSLLGYEPGSSGEVISSYPIWMLIVNLAVSAVLPGICEEVAHRGMLVHAYRPLGIKKAILLSGLLFGLMHLNIDQFFYATLIGFLFGFITIMTDSIYPSMIMHFMNNAISTFLQFSLINNNFIGKFVINLETNLMGLNPFAAFMGILIIISVMIFLLVWLTTLLIKETTIKKLKKVADEVIADKLRRDLFVGTSLEQSEQPQNNNVVVREIEVNNKKIFNIDFRNRYNQVYKPSKKDNIFLVANLVMCSLITLFTFIWGVI